MDRTIVVQRPALTVIDAAGTPVETWVDVATLRAQIVKASTEEFIRDGGSSDETAVVFRTHWLDGVTNNDRIIYQGVVHSLREIKEIGRRQALELRTSSTGDEP